jgi:hypothetical protein
MEFLRTTGGAGCLRAHAAGDLVLGGLAPASQTSGTESRGIKGLRKLNCLAASAGDLLTTGTFRRRPINAAMSRNGMPSSATP